MDEVRGGPRVPASPLQPQGDLRSRLGWRQPDRVAEPLYVVVPIYNAFRWKSRWKHAARSLKHFVESGAVVYVVEAAFGEREHAMHEIAPQKMFAHTPPIADELAPNCRHDPTTRGQHRYVPLRTKTEAWLKENLINIGVSFLPQDWKYLAWLDADILFSRPNWVGETIHKLQHYKFLQMFSQAQDLGPDYTVIAQRPGFVSAYETGALDTLYNSQYQARTTQYPATSLGAWSGLAWACTRDAWNAVGGLIPWAIHGGADYHMAWALIGQVDKSLRRDCHPNYLAGWRKWQAMAERMIRRNVGCMTGTVQHFFHGKKANRKYSDRHRLLAETQFDPMTDVRFGSHGILQLTDDGTDRFIRLRDGLRRYALARNEDGTDP